MTPVRGLAVLGGVALVVAGFIGLTHWLGVAEFWAGFLFLLYWAGIQHMEFDELSSCCVGALLGLLMAYLLHALPGVLGDSGGLVFLGLVLALVYCQVMGLFPVAINMMTMLFLTVGTIPIVQEHASFRGMLAALMLGIGYFAGLIWAGTQLAARRGQAAA